MKSNSLALWAGISAFFATLLGVGVIDIFNPTDQVRLASGVVVGLITAGAVYSKQRLDDAKKEHDGIINVAETEDIKTFSLELKGDPEDLEHKQEVTFKVNKPGA
jgi:small neutral amino acid transporter SnatA (MarC family)